MAALSYLIGNFDAAGEECEAFFEASGRTLFYLIGNFDAAGEECEAFFEASGRTLFYRKLRHNNGRMRSILRSELARFFMGNFAIKKVI